MDIGLKKLFGLTPEDDDKRIYKIIDGEVKREEFEYCQVLDQLVFGEKGYVETLGPTWELIHDPRFAAIESSFIVNRRAIFGGDARTGKQYVSSEGTFTSTIADLEQYSEVLGEGRYFYYVLTHDKSCPVCLWYLRIFPALLAAEGKQAPTPSADLTCNCTPTLDAHLLKDQSDEYLWNLIKQECPNYFMKDGKPNQLATRLFDLFRADLVGLIADYAITPMSDLFIQLETGDVIQELQEHGEPMAPDLLPGITSPHWSDKVETPQVFLEVDTLEKALTYRAMMRATAAKVLRQVGFHKKLKQIGEIRLTDLERDQLLRVIYEPQTVGGMKISMADNYFAYLHEVEREVEEFLQQVKATGKDFATRQQEQLQQATIKAQETIAKLQSGEIASISQANETQVDVPLDSHAAIMQSILKNPLKQELFVIWAEAERRGDEGKTDDERLRMKKLFSILTPMFTDPDFRLTEDEFFTYLEQAKRMGYFAVGIDEVEETFGTEA